MEAGLNPWVPEKRGAPETGAAPGLAAGCQDGQVPDEKTYSTLLRGAGA